MFHEFGHALHGLNSSVRYPTLAGTNTKRDFVEFPSQLNEHWLRTPEVLGKFAVHHQTGKPIPKRARRQDREGEELQPGLPHRRVPVVGDLRPEDPHRADRQADRRGRVREAHDEGDRGAGGDRDAPPPDPVRPHLLRRRLLRRLLLYIWADTLTADAAEAFAAAGSFYDKATAKRLHESIMSVGNSIPPDEAFRKFRGRDVDTNALMRDRGFPVGL